MVFVYNQLSVRIPSGILTAFLGVALDTKQLEVPAPGLAVVERDPAVSRHSMMGVALRFNAVHLQVLGSLAPVASGPEHSRQMFSLPSGPIFLTFRHRSVLARIMC